jgi:short-chain Z-isoprenyl diphosphate synthase
MSAWRLADARRQRGGPAASGGAGAGRGGVAPGVGAGMVRGPVDGGEGWGMGLRDLVYRVCERRLEASLSGRSVPRHVGVILDGNRRWARSVGLAGVSSGHQKGADHIVELLDWCRRAGVEVVTLWLLSTGHLARPGAEAGALLQIMEGAVRGLAAKGWHVKPVGALDLLPAETARVLKDAAGAAAATPGLLVNVAVGYGGRRTPTPRGKTRPADL